MVAVPAAIPVTSPDALTLATAAFVLLQVPPVVASVSVVVADGQMEVAPPMAAIVGTDVTVMVATA